MNDERHRAADGPRGPRPTSAPPPAPEAHPRRGALHAGAWWLWALGLATAASRTSNPLLLGLLIGVAGYVVAARRTDAPWARSYGAFLKLGIVVLVIRLVFAVFLGSPIPGTRLLFTLPEVPLPHWAEGVRIGGRVTAEGLVFALYDGLKLATLLICVGAANALANPSRLLKSLPGALYEAGVAVVVAMTFAPNLVADVQRLRAARRLRGRSDQGVRALLRVGLPVLEGALERSVALAAAMDARGYGRTAQVPPAVRHTTTALTLGGLLGVCAGSYGLLAAQGAGYGLPLVLAGLAAALGGLWLGGRRSMRSRYRPDRWDTRAWLVSGSGVAVAALMIWADGYAPGPLHPPAVPLTAPELPLWPALSVLVGLIPAVAAPPPPRSPGAPARRPGRPPRTDTPPPGDGPGPSGGTGPQDAPRPTGGTAPSGHPGPYHDVGPSGGPGAGPGPHLGPGPGGDPAPGGEPDPHHGPTDGGPIPPRDTSPRGCASPRGHGPRRADPGPWSLSRPDGKEPPR